MGEHINLLQVDQQVSLAFVLGEHHRICGHAIFVILGSLMQGLVLAWDSSHILEYPIVLYFGAHVGAHFLAGLVYEYADVR